MPPSTKPSRRNGVRSRNAIHWRGENEKLRRQNQRLQEELEKAHIVIDVQKKVAKLLGRPIPEIPGTEK